MDNEWTTEEKVILLCRTWANEALLRIAMGSYTEAAQVLRMLIENVDNMYEKIREITDK